MAEKMKASASVWYSKSQRMSSISFSYQRLLAWHDY